MSAVALEHAGLFERISLRELDRRASLQTRVDRKYVVRVEELEQLLPVLATTHAVLDIGGRTSFTYNSVYYDSARLSSFRAHRQSRRRRFKCRTREYVDSGLCFFEVKIKGQRGRTLKERIPLADALGLRLDDGCHNFLVDVMRRHYGTEPVEEHKAVLSMRYERTTFAAFESANRVTVDSALAYTGRDGKAALRHGFVVVESKSELGKSSADRALRALRQRPVGRCSKYCLGVALTRRDVGANDFLPLIRRHFLVAYGDTDEKGIAR